VTLSLKTHQVLNPSPELWRKREYTTWQGLNSNMVVGNAVQFFGFIMKMGKGWNLKAFSQSSV
jgi:hypothetical protein